MKRQFQDVMKKSLVRLTRGDIALGVAVGLPLVLLLGSFAGLSGAFAGGFLGMLAAQLRRTALDALQVRAQSSTAEIAVRVNDVEVGTLRDADYAAIRLDVLNNPFAYKEIAMNALSAASRVVANLMITIPICVFWLWGAALLFASDELRQAVVWGEPQQWTHLSQGVFGAIAAIVILVVGCSLCLSNTFGMTDVFKARTVNAIRRHLGIAAVGSMTLMVYEPREQRSGIKAYTDIIFLS